MEENNSQLTITDIALTRDVIDLACKRGAFSGAEAKQVGTLFEKLDQFIKAAVEQADAEANAELTAEAGVPDSAETPPVTKTKGK